VHAGTLSNSSFRLNGYIKGSEPWPKGLKVRWTWDWCVGSKAVSALLD